MDAIKTEKRNCSAFYGNGEGSTIDSETVSSEMVVGGLEFGETTIRFFNTPGHTDASISFVSGQYLFTGDTLIKGKSTVTKLPTGSHVKLRVSMSLYMTMLGKGYHVLPGHGESFDLDGYDLNRMSK